MKMWFMLIKNLWGCNNHFIFVITISPLFLSCDQVKTLPPEGFFAHLLGLSATIIQK